MNNSKFEIREKGDLFVLRGKQEDLLDAANKIIKALDPSSSYEQSEVKEWLIYNKEELKLRGIYAVYFNKDELYIQNRSARKNHPTREIMKKAVESI